VIKVRDGRVCQVSGARMSAKNVSLSMRMGLSDKT